MSRAQEPKQILSFLGASPYDEAEYELDGKTYLTPYTQEALARHYKDHTVLVAMTEEARSKHADGLRARGVNYTPIPIPSGSVEEELWAIFEAITEHVPEGAEVVVDISHSFRSQPVLALAALRFLEAAKDVKVSRILYASYDQRAKRGRFLDLTLFLTLMRWSEATSELVRYGFTRNLATLLKEIQDDAWRGGKQGPKPQRLKTLGQVLEELGLALEFLRVPETLELARKLLEESKRVEEESQAWLPAQPIRALLEKLRQRYEPLAVEEAFSPDGLKAQAHMVDLLLEIGSYHQAAVLIRELMVTKVCLDQGLHPLDKDGRDKAEGYLNQWLKEGHDETLRQWGNTWKALSDLRNDLAHAGMRRQARKGPGAERELQEKWAQIRNLLDL
ncbi:CRISPR-associated protein DxTHG motif-containing protein [Thermus oshimai JL-2]|uniref:CRISPR-associated protein DxTHG motif-containing protein n=1 Tax=Thermus oshimai JL-2 TaxID=751945 RepID=K7QUG9_THEOS|nr:TM1812 family CRISPR-associated protein [Thermus oshimai]AFV75886.1 CRISPR-associated protein DxTHG motif-containing protein [Thermus oshimai JL-2]